MKIRFVILLPEEINKFATQLGKKLAEGYGTYFFVDNQRLFSHITLARVEIKRSSLGRIFRETKKLSETLPSLQLRIIGFWAARGYLTLNVHRTERLSKFHHQVRSFISKFGADPMPRRDKPYRPHITMLRYKDPRIAARLAKTLSKPKQRFTVDTLAVCLYDEHGQVHKILEKFPLKS